MPRIRRQYSNYLNVYHVIIRGIDKQDIFLDKQDKYTFLKYIKEYKEKYNYEVYAYCLMDNHVHMVIYDKDMKISKIMQSIEIKYSAYFNKKYTRVGHLFQNRFSSRLVEDKGYFLQLCRYIHQNPYKAKIEKTEKYIWSSYQEYINCSDIISSSLMFSIMTKDEFIQFHKNNTEQIEDFLEYEIKENFDDEQVENYIRERYKLKKSKEILNYSNEIRNKYLVEITNIRGISIIQLARVLGINYKIIQRARTRQEKIIKNGKERIGEDVSQIGQKCP